MLRNINKHGEPPHSHCLGCGHGVKMGMSSFAEGGDASSSLSGQERSFRNTGAAHLPVHIEDEIFCRQRSRIVLGSRVPYVASDVYVAPNAIVVGDVDMFDRVSPPPQDGHHQHILKTLKFEV